MKEIAILLCFSALFITGCNKTDDFCMGCYTIPPFQQPDFPAKGGNYWVYICSNNFGQSQDSVILMEKYVDSISAKQKIIHFVITNMTNVFIDSAIGNLTTDSFEYISSTHSNYFGDFKMILPLNNIYQWVSIDIRDTFEYNFIEGGSTYGDEYDLVSMYNHGGVKRQNIINLVSGIGIVGKLVYQDTINNPTSANRSFTLVRDSIH